MTCTDEIMRCQICKGWKWQDPENSKRKFGIVFFNANKDWLERYLRIYGIKHTMRLYIAGCRCPDCKKC